MFTDMSPKQKILLGIAALIVLTGVSIAASWLYVTYTVADTIYPMTTIDGIDMGYKTKEEATKLLKKRDEYYRDALIEVVYKDQKIATLSGQDLQLERDIDTKVDQAYIVGRSTNIPSRIAQQMNTLLKIRTFPFITQIRFNEGPVNEFLSQNEEFYNREPKNALFTFADGKVTSFRTDEPGNRLKSDQFVLDFQKKIQELSATKKLLSVTLTEEKLDPEITLSEANNLGIEELIGEGHSDYTHSIPTRIHNVKLSASKFDGIIIPKGEEFSFNKVIGDISANTGYQQAYVIKNGRTVLGDGGGVCQTSTTMFRAALNTGLPITERNAHAYRVSYYENDSAAGFDATIFSPTVDLKFVNDTPAAILIQMEIDEDNKLLAFKMYGKKDGRTVEISPATVWGTAPPPEPLYEDDPTLKVGVVKQVDYAAWGAKAKFEYKVKSATGTEIQNKTFVSAYRPWQAVFLRGTAQ
ncbi:VanW family protein [Candidatus Woesebacteria bacterium]|nr:VanW family protein [Candidatus Woesebacteria bacterium]